MKHNINRGRRGHAMQRWQFAGLALGLGLFSYHARELLVCWLFLALLIAVVALGVLAILLVCSAGRHLGGRIKSAWECKPEITVVTPDSALLRDAYMAEAIMVPATPMTVPIRNTAAMGMQAASIGESCKIISPQELS